MLATYDEAPPSLLPWELETDGDDWIVTAPEAASEIARLPRLEGAETDARHIVAAVNAHRDLAETVASEPERIAAAVAAEVDRIYRAATVGLDDYLAADAKLLDALGRGEVIDEYHPLILARMRRLDYLRGLLAPVTP